MRRLFTLATLTALVAAATGCDGLKDALSAHADVVATAGDRELSVDRLADLIAKSPVELADNFAQNREMAQLVSSVWVNYQLLGRAAALNDTLNDPAMVDSAMWMQLDQMRIGKLGEIVSKQWTGSDTVVTEAEYNQGNLLSAAHILFMFPPNANQAAIDSVRRVAEGVRARVTSANFADMAKQYSEDPGSKDRGGLYTAFPRGPDPAAMVKEFEDGVIALRPGEISGLVQSQFGFHIIRRPLFEEVRAEHSQAKAMRSATQAQEEYFRNLTESGKIEVKGNAAKVIREVAADIDGHRNSRTVLATTAVGNFTAGDLVRWLRTIPPAQNVAEQIASLPDSVIPRLLDEPIRSLLLRRQADSAGITLDSNEVASVRGSFNSSVYFAWQQLGVLPGNLGDSTATRAQRLQEAGDAVDRYFAGMMSSANPYVDVQTPLETVLRNKYDYNFRESGLERAIERAQTIRASLAATRPPVQPAPGQNAPPPAGTVPPPVSGDTGGGPPGGR